MFSDILITADFDHTLTARDGSVPERNLQAIRYFMENGGVFTVNTGRSVPMFSAFMELVPMNAPLLACNGGVAYDTVEKKPVYVRQIGLDMAKTMAKMEALFPQLVTEVEGLQAHYIFKENPMWSDWCANNRCPGRVVPLGTDVGPFVKFCVMGPIHDNTVAGLYRGTEAQIACFDRVEAQMRALFGGDTAVYRSAARIVDVHPKEASKLRAALELKESLGRKLLICIGDGENDVSMLNGADYAYCPADARIADRYENVCACGEGAVADVIYKKIPGILNKKA